MITPPALGGALMDAHDRIETAGAMTPEWMRAVHDSILAERHLAAITGWSQERVNQRGCQLWGELHGDDRWAEVGAS